MCSAPPTAALPRGFCSSPSPRSCSRPVPLRELSTQALGGLEITPDSSTMIVAPDTNGHQIEFLARNEADHRNLVIQLRRDGQRELCLLPLRGYLPFGWRR